MTKSILIINANPKKDSLDKALAEHYAKGAKEAGADIHLIHLKDIEFDPILWNGYGPDQDIEPELKNIQKKIEKADHLVFVFPVWWGTYPALLKGFIDRVFLPGFAFRFKGSSLKWEGFFKGKSSRLIATLDTPKWYYFLGYKSPAINSLKKGVLEFCGVKPVKVTLFSPVKKADETKRNEWLGLVESLGKRLQ